MTAPAPPISEAKAVPVVVVGGGQAGLAASYYLRRHRIEHVILDAQSRPGGTWRHGWDSLRLFSPARFSALPGWWMPDQPGEPYPTAAHVRDYLAAYEQRYHLPVQRPVDVTDVTDVTGVTEDPDDEGLLVTARRGQQWRAEVVISATGSWRRPHWPAYPGNDEFRGRQLHTVSYHRPEPFAGERVAVVGGGNSAAQILAEVSTVADTVWVAPRPPRLLPDDVDGRALFDLAARSGGVSGLGDVVAVPSVRAARDRGVLHAHPMFDRITPTGLAWDRPERGSPAQSPVDTIIWCTGFRPDLPHLDPLELSLAEGDVPATAPDSQTRSLDQPRLHLLGYGDWTGPASATLIGAGRAAKSCVAEVATQLAGRAGQAREGRGDVPKARTAATTVTPARSTNTGG